ncbi:CLUMA_CG021601, isoform A [Clunio marinus]|uniref:CLUMA_CG021601, isoform A n=1 Tax=Clunio marinus TaxID=568069 RepID=A0A1J1J7S8_9DIPT|nr:CLUMA_CG021601, isoform A [Clunio marinus]
MGTALLRIVARRRNDKTSLNDLNNNNKNLELGECVFNSKELLLLESPPLGTCHRSKEIFHSCEKRKSVKIGKIAKTLNRKIKHEQQVIVKYETFP